jgi:uncharacterized protein YjbJ (UPF0337 family)
LAVGTWSNGENGAYEDAIDERQHVNASRTPASRNRDRSTARTIADCDGAVENRRTGVDKNRTEGTKHEVKGAIKETVGKVTGNVGKQVAGNLEKNAGKLQHAVGKASDEQREADKKRRP